MKFQICLEKYSVVADSLLVNFFSSVFSFFSSTYFVRLSLKLEIREQLQTLQIITENKLPYNLLGLV